MTAYFHNTVTGDIIRMPVAANQNSYQIELPAGSYIAYAWLPGGEFGGSYSQAVPCGLSVECNNHKLIVFDVLPNGTIGGIDLCDWYGQPGDVPSSPDAGSQPTGYDYPPLAGLTYQNPEGLWLVGEENQHIFVGELVDGALSPSRDQILFTESEDIWILDLNSQQRRNLTNTPDRIEHFPQWWPAKPGAILFFSIPREEPLGPGITGYLTYMPSDGSVYKVLDNEHFAGLFAPSPDGTRIAYGVGETGWILEWDGAIQPFDPEDYGLTSLKGQSVVSPAWSPDGNQLAWVWLGTLNVGDRAALAVFDLVNQQARLLHVHELPGSDAIPEPPSWSRDGQWLAYSHLSFKLDESGLWVIRADGKNEEEFLFNMSSSPLWSPDGQWLGFVRNDPQGVSGMFLARVGSWDTQPADVPADAYHLQWP